MAKKPDHSYVNDNGKRVSGSAAFLNYVYTQKGGVQEYNDEIGGEYIKTFIQSHSDSINEELTKKAKKSRLKVM